MLSSTAYTPFFPKCEMAALFGGFDTRKRSSNLSKIATSHKKDHASYWCAWSTPSGAENPSSPEISLWRPQNWYGLTLLAPKWMSGIHPKSSGIYDPSPCGYPPLLAHIFHIFPETLGRLDSGSAVKAWIGVGRCWLTRWYHRRIPGGLAVQPPIFTTDPRSLSDLSDWVMLAVERQKSHQKSHIEKAQTPNWKTEHQPLTSKNSASDLPPSRQLGCSRYLTLNVSPNIKRC